MKKIILILTIFIAIGCSNSSSSGGGGSNGGGTAPPVTSDTNWGHTYFKDIEDLHRYSPENEWKHDMGTLGLDFDYDYNRGDYIYAFDKGAIGSFMRDYDNPDTNYDYSWVNYKEMKWYHEKSDGSFIEAGIISDLGNGYYELQSVNGTMIVKSIGKSPYDGTNYYVRADEDSGFGIKPPSEDGTPGISDNSLENNVNLGGTSESVNTFNRRLNETRAEMKGIGAQAAAITASAVAATQQLEVGEIGFGVGHGSYADKNSQAFSVGLKPTENFNMNASWSHSDSNSDMWSAGMGYKFKPRFRKK